MDQPVYVAITNNRIRDPREYTVCKHILGTYAGCRVALVGVLGWHLVLVVVVVLGARHTLREVEEPSVRAVGGGGHVAG